MSSTIDTADAIDEIIHTLARTAPEIRSGLPGRREKGEEENPSGERQLAADVYADDLLEERLLAIPDVVAYASEERDDVIEAETVSDEADGSEADGGKADSGGTDGERGGLHVGVDPLDGSSNLESNNAMGTIVAIYDAPLPASGRDLLAAAYVLFGPITTMTVAREEDDGTGGADGASRANGANGADRVTEADGDDRDDGTNGTVTEYLVREDGYEALREDVSLPDEPLVYGFGGRVPDWPAAFAEFADDVESDLELKLRYGGAMIGDVNQVMTYGGVFAYPALQSASQGKLRLQFEGNPMAYIVESAGGRSSDGERSLLAIEPDDLHGRVPVHVGNAELIDRLEETLSSS